MSSITWTNERRKLSQLIPWPRNPRQIKRPQVERLQASLEEFGQVEPVAIGPDGELYNGHQRLKSWMQRFGDIEIDVRVSSRPLSEKEREKLTVFLHKGAAGEWDFDALANGFEVEELVEWGFSEAELLGKDNKGDIAQIVDALPGVKHLAWNERYGSSFLSVRSWSSKEKDAELDFVKKRKYNEDTNFVAEVVGELITAIASIFPLEAFKFVTTPPRSSKTEYHLASDIANKLAQKINAEFLVFFEGENKINKNIMGARPPCKLKQGILVEVAGQDYEEPILLVDDICTTGKTIINSSVTMRAAGYFVLPIVWIYRDRAKK